MANQISGDNFLSHQLAKQQKSDALPGASHSPDRANQAPAQPAADQANINRALQRLAQQSEGTGEPAIVSAEGAQHQAAQLKALISGSPATALKAHGGIDSDLFEAVTARPAA